MIAHPRHQTDLILSQHFSYPNGFSGDPTMLEALAIFMNAYFHPRKPVETKHIATAPGAASCLDAFLYTVCDPGDGVLVPGPYWSMFVRTTAAGILNTKMSRWIRFPISCSCICDSGPGELHGFQIYFDHRAHTCPTISL